MGNYAFDAAYDSRSCRVVRKINGVITANLYDDWSLISERDASDQQLAGYIHGANLDEILLRVSATGSTYSHHDGLGSTTALTDSAGNILERYTYDIYGEPKIFALDGLPQANSASGNRFLYTGREWLAELQLNDYRHRYYQPQIGRWLSRDPLPKAEQVAGTNVYSYVANEPITLIDPLGLQQYSNQTAAARAAIKAANPNSIKGNVEACGNVCKDDNTGKFFTTGPASGTIAGCDPISAPCPPCSKRVAYWHTHGAFTDANGDGIDDYDSENFSPDDRNYADRNNVDGYVGTPNGQVKHYDHNGKRDYTKKHL